MARFRYMRLMLMRVGSPEHDEFVSTTSVGLAWSDALARMAMWPLTSSVTGEFCSSLLGNRGSVSARNRASSSDDLAAGRGVCRIGSDPRHVGKASVLVDPQIDRPRIDAEGHPVAALGDGHRLVLTQFRRMEDFAAGNQQRLAPREGKARLGQGLLPVRGVDRALGRELKAVNRETRIVGTGHFRRFVQGLQESRRVGREAGRQRRELAGVRRLNRVVLDNLRHVAVAPLRA